MKRLGALLLAAVMLFGLGACSAKDASSYDPDQADHGPKIVCTTYPICDWAKQILGDAAEECQLVLLGGSGVDLHSYQPSVADIAAIASCDLFFYVGGESDEWVEDALAIDHKDTRAAFSLMEILEERLKEEEHKEGMQEEAAEFGAFIADQGAEQCGFCNPGFMMNAMALFREDPDPSEEKIKAYLAGNLCRCSGYEGQLRGIQDYLAWKKRKEGTH